MEILLEYRTVFLILHIIAAVLGVGGATISDILFFKFLKDYKISDTEKDILDTMSKVIWIGLGVAYISGLALYLPGASDYNTSSKFLTKMFVLAVITINGVFLNLKIAPKLTSIPFDKPALKIKDKSIVRIRHLAYASGAVSIVSWYSALVLGMLRSIPMTITQGVLLYLAVLIIAVTGSQVMERFHCN